MWTVIATSLKAILAVAVVGGTATAIVAPAFDMASGRGAALNQPTATHAPDATDAPDLDFETLLLACLDSADADSTACGYAQAKSGLTPADFRLKILEKLTPDAVTAQPTTEPSPEPTKKPEPIVAKRLAGVTNGFDTLLKRCLETRDEKSDACIRAGKASGMKATDWSVKIRGKLEASRRSDFATYFEKCLATRDIRSDVCLRAQELIGFNDADFHAKFERFLAERDAKSGKATAAPKPTTSTFDALLKACGQTHDKSSDPCLRALVMSGLQPAEFWAKVEAKFGSFR